MFRLIGFFLVAGVLMFGAAWLFDNDNPLQIRWFDGEVYEWSLAYLILAGLAFAAASVAVFELLRVVLGYPARWWRRRQINRRLEGFVAATKGLIAAAAGDGVEAKELRREAERYLGDRDPATLLLAAQAAEMEGNHEVAQLKYRQMLKRSETRLLGLRGLLQDALASGDEDEALALARQAFAQRPYTEWVVRTLFDLLTRKGNWSEAFRRVDDLKLNNLIDADEAQRLRSILKLLTAKELVAAGDEAEGFKAALDAAKRQRGFAPASVFASELARKRDKPRLARELLEESWSRQPHPATAAAYAALVENESAASRLARFERLAAKNPQHPITLKTMIELALAAGKTDVALRYAKQVTARAPAGTLQAALEAYRADDPTSPKIAELEGLIAQAPADEAWVCQKTGQVVDTWQPYGMDGSFDGLRWQSPPRVAQFVAAGERDAAFAGRTVDLEAAPAG